MKRKVVTWIAALLLALSVGALFGCGAKHTHTFSEEWAADETHHWHECACGERIDVSQHNYNEITGDCVCGAHQHVYSAEWSKDDTHHWYYAICAHGDQKDQYMAHDYDENYACKICGYQHEHVFDENCKCTVCGYQHEHTYNEQWSYDDSNHWHEATCEHIDKINDLAEHSFYREKCTVCGFMYFEGLAYYYCKDFDNVDYCIVSGIGHCTDVDIVIPSEHEGLPVKGIAGNAFKDNKEIKSVQLPNSVTDIDGYAFENCTNLSGITISNNLTHIGNNAFNGCTSLANIDIPNGTMSIGDYAFYGCSSLTKIVVPDTVTHIGNSAFGGCVNLESITLPFIGNTEKTAKDDDQYPFGVIFGHVYSGYDDTEYTQVKQSYIYLPGPPINWTKSITCYIPLKLKLVILTGGEILAHAFEGCPITDIVIPNNVTKINHAAFDGCAVERVYYTGTQSEYNTIVIENDNNKFSNATHYFYSETKPNESGNFWHFDTDGVTPIVWENGV